MKLPDGDTFDGSFKELNQPDSGILKFNNGNTYSGDLGPSSISTSLSESSSISLSMNGSGKLNFKNGSHYIGEFKDGLMDGEG